MSSRIAARDAVIMADPHERPRWPLAVLAAGAGSRYGGLKQLVPVGPSGEALLEYSVFDALRAGCERVVLVVRPETEPEFRRRLDGGMARRVPVSYVHQRVDAPLGGEPSPQRVKPWGTGHAVLAAGAAVEGPFGLVNADDYYGAEAYAVLASFLTAARDGRRLAVLGFPVAATLSTSGPVSRALLDVGAGGELREIVELFEVRSEGGRILHRDAGGRERALRGDERVSMNMWGLTPDVIPEFRRRFAEFLARARDLAEAEFLLPEVIQSMIRQGRFRVDVLPASGEWCGLTFRRDRQRVRSVIGALIAAGRYPQDLWA